MKPKPKVCRVCKAPFWPSRSTQIVCTWQHALEWAGLKADKEATATAKQEAKAHRDKVAAAKPKSYFAKLAQAAFNRWVRLRDIADGCISCDRPATWGGQWHASHYRSRGAAPELAYDPDNVHKACSICNAHLSGNIAGYRRGLSAKIGVEKVEWLEGPHEPAKYTIEQLKEIKANYTKMAKEMT